MIIKSYEIQNKTNNFLNYNFFLLYGENQGLKKDIVESINKIANLQDSKIEFINWYESDVLENQENFYNSIYSGSLFSNKKIITISYGTDKIVKEIEDIVNKNPENTFIIVLADVLEKKSKLRYFFEKNNKTLCVPCYLDTDKSLRFIAQAELKKNNVILSIESLNLLIEKSNYDRYNLRNEIEKINSFAETKKKLEVAEIKSIINFSGEYKADNIINECLCGNIIEYKKILSELYMGTINQIYLLRVLSNKIQKLLNMKEVENNYDTIDNLLDTSKPPIFWKEKPMIKKQLSIWSLVDLQVIINDINNTELLCKKNPHISKSIFFNFFNTLCKKANNFS